MRGYMHFYINCKKLQKNSKNSKNFKNFYSNYKKSDYKKFCNFKINQIFHQKVMN